MNTGKAYAFFDCDASRKDIENELPHIRQISQTPNELELLLCEGTDELIFDEDLQEKLQYPDDYRIMSEERMKQGYEEERRPLGSLRYVMIGSFPGESNERVAGELGNILNYVGYLNQDQSIFRGAITYEKNGEYVLRE